MGPFTATSGVVLPYYLNLATNFLDKEVAPAIVQLVEEEIDHYLKGEWKYYVPEDRPLLCLGMEVAGGIMVSQLASSSSGRLHGMLDFCYVRKERKSTGTKQQLEGPQLYTSRSADSAPIFAICIDDALSTGSSLHELVTMMWEGYRIRVVGALYLVDRTEDRAHLADEKQFLAREEMDQVAVRAIYSLAEIDREIPRSG
jgi:orotate phosphoribosyltransferase